MSKSKIIGIKEGQDVIIFRNYPFKNERSFIFFVGTDIVITSLGTVLTPDSQVTIFAMSQGNTNFLVDESAIQAKTNYLLSYHSDIPVPLPEPE